MNFTYKNHTALVHWSTLPIGVVYDIEPISVRWHRGGPEFTYTKIERSSKSLVKLLRSGGYFGTAFNEEKYAYIPLLRIKGVSK